MTMPDPIPARLAALKSMSVTQLKSEWQTIFATAAVAYKWLVTRCSRSATSVAARLTQKSLIAAHVTVMLIAMTWMKMMQ